MQHPNRYQEKSEGWGRSVCARGVGRVGGGEALRGFVGAQMRMDVKTGETKQYVCIYIHIYI